MKSRRSRITALFLTAFIIISAAAGCGSGTTDDSGNANAAFSTNGSGSTNSINTEAGSNNAAGANNGNSVAQSTGRPKSNTPSAPMDTAEIHFIDVGQGDSTLIIANSEAMLIDCGDNDRGMSVRRYLEKQGIEELEYVIGTHPDADHIGGMDVVLYNFYCDKVIMPDSEADTKTYDDVIQTMKSKNYSITYPQVGDTYTLGSGSFTIIAPNRDDYGDRNDFSVGLIFDYGSTSFVFTGDAEGAEVDIAGNGVDLSADVFKAGHHGSSTSSGDAILNAVNPKYAVISCGAGNKYGHPHRETLQRFASRNIEVYRTDTQGTVIAYTDGINITWSCGANTDLQVQSENQPQRVQGADSVQSSAALQSTANNSPASTAGNPPASLAVNQSTAPTFSSNNTEASVSYILNTNTKKYHLPTCRSVKQMSDSNKEESNLSAAEIEALGYEACKNCLQ